MKLIIKTSKNIFKKHLNEKSDKLNIIHSRRKAIFNSDDIVKLNKKIDQNQALENWK